MDLLLLLFIFLVLPNILTVLNLVNLFKQKQVIPRISYTLTLLLGPLFMFLLMDINAKGGGIFPLLETGAGVTGLICVTLGILALLILVHAKGSALSPPAAGACFFGVCAGALCCVVFLAWYMIVVGFGDPFIAFYMMLFPFNFILCSVRLLKKT